jgi:hypothetical protein
MVGRAAVALAIVAVATSPGDLVSCGPNPLFAVFTSYSQNKTPADDFAQNNLGILQPEYDRLHLALAYRIMQGLSIDELQREATPKEPEEPPPAGLPATFAWVEARKAVAGGTPQNEFILTYKLNPVTHAGFENCKDAAFAAATARLRALAIKYGPDSSVVKDWLAAQDLVFSDCAEGSAIPAPLPASASAEAQADRNYQIAAAHFYTGDYDRARAEFAAISKDESSLWRELGPYLEARALIRKGDLAGAHAQLQTILADPKQTAGHDRAVRLLRFVDVRLHPGEAAQAISREFLSKQPRDMRQLLADYTYLYDRFERERYLDKAAAADDMTDWIYAFHSPGMRPKAYAAAKWRITKRSHWLLAALAAAEPGDANTPELIVDAGKMAKGSPGYLSTQYYAVRLLELRNEKDTARARLNALLAGRPPKAARNMLLAARMKIARNGNEFLRDAQRTPVSEVGYDYDSYRSNGRPTHDPNAISFDEDAVIVLNGDAPLEFVAEAAKRRDLPGSIRQSLARAAWTRAVLVDRMDVARDLAPVLGSLVPELDRDMKQFAAADSTEGQFEAAWVLLRSPGLTPTIQPGFGRLTPVKRLNDFRDNWWCEFNSPVASNEGRFLSAAQRNQAAEERKALASSGSGPEYLGRIVLEWAKVRPEDPRLPEALHRTVRATRFGCSGEKTAKYSKAAFDLLHRRFAGSKWAKETPYWFDGR